MIGDVYKDYIPNLIDSMLLNLEVSDSNFLLIKHYNTFDLTKEYVNEIALANPKQRFLYHSFDAGSMLGAFEPFVEWIKQLFYELSDESLDSFFEESRVYALHRPIFKSFFETGVCKRKEEILVTEVEFEKRMFIEEIIRMLHRLSKKRPLVLILNRLHGAGSSTIKLVTSLLANRHSKNIAVLATYNEIAPELKYVKDYWADLLKKFDEYDCIIDWTLSTVPLATDNSVFKFSNNDLSEYFIKLNNMMNMLALTQATFYLDIMYHKFEVEKLYIIPKYKFIFLEMYAKIAMYQDKISDALLYNNGMRLIMEVEDNLGWRFKYNYLAGQIHMYGFQKESVNKYIQEAIKISKHLNNPFLEYKAALLKHMAHFNGWRNIWLLDTDEYVEDDIINKSKKYEYFNHLAHIYVYSFDNDYRKYSDVNGIEERLSDFSRGIEIATRLGNDQFLIEAYKKNVMAASTNGFFDVANYFYGKCYEIVTKNGDLFEEGGIYNGRGYNCCTIEKYAKANEYFNKALLIFAQLNEIDCIMETLYNMAINAMLAEDYSVADTYLGTCLKVIRIMKSNSVRVCNISKIYGLRALCCYKMKILYNCKTNLQYVEQFLGHIIEMEDNDEYDTHLWDDDLFLYYFVNALLLEHDNKLDQAYEKLSKAKKYVERSKGSEFFNLPPYAIAFARICKKLERYEQANAILNSCLEFCDEKGYIYKKNMIKSEIEGTTYNPMKWNLTMKGITIDEIVEMSVRKGMTKSYEEQKNDIEFLSIWQKLINNPQESVDRMVYNSITTLKNNYNIDEVIFIQIEEGIPIIRYNDSCYEIDDSKIDYLVEYFNKNRTEFATSRLDKSYIEYKELIENVFGVNSINTLLCAPIFVNEELNSLFVSSIYLGVNWNYMSRRYTFDDDDLSIIMLLFRQLLDAMERMEAQQKIERINNELQFVNERLKSLAVSDTLTGLYNRQGFNEELETQINRAKQAKDVLNLSFLYADLDNFKYYNDTFGHDIGDLILKEFSLMINSICGSKGYAVRYGGDEFILVLYTNNRDITEQAAKDIYAVLEKQRGFQNKISRALGKKVKIPKERNVSCSIGISQTEITPEDNPKEKVDETLKRADEMMYYVKKTTKHRYVFYEDVKDDVEEFFKKEAHSSNKKDLLSDR